MKSPKMDYVEMDFSTVFLWGCSSLLRFVGAVSEVLVLSVS